MTDMMSKISAGLERAFANRGFAEPSVEDLRDAADVSLRTLYKYTPSRAEMVLAALEKVISREAELLAYISDFRLLAVIIVICIPVVFLMRDPLRKETLAGV